MAKPMTPEQTLAAMKKWHVPYREYPGWKTRTRPGAHSDMHGIVIHHTGSDAGQSDDYLKFLFVDGRASEGIPGPLCNVATDMDGDLWVGAYGRANHAGKGSSATLAHATNEDYKGFTVELNPGPDDTDGNAHFYGNEVRYDGGQPMTAKQYDAAVRWAAAICDFHGWSALSVIGHREWTDRKDDPGHCPMWRFRMDVAARLAAGPGGVQAPPTDTPTTPQENDVLNPDDKKWLTGEIQRFSAFGALHTDQVEATTDDDVDLILKDDFAELGAGIATLIKGQTDQTAALNRLAAAIEATAPKA